MKVVDINNIDEVYQFKNEVQDALGTGMIDLAEFINDYMQTGYLYTNLPEGITMTFDIKDIEGTKYLLVSDNNHADDIMKILENVNYDVSRLRELSQEDMMNESLSKMPLILSTNGKYYHAF